MRILLGLLLLVGVALLGIGAVLHPMLDGSAADQLRLIAATPYWRAIHLTMLAGSACLITGLWIRHLDRAFTPPLTIIAIGLALNAFDIAVMASAGTHMAAAFVAGNTAMATVYEATHLIGVMTARFGNGLVALGALLLGWAEWTTTPRQPVLATLAWLAAVGGLVGALAFDETSRAILSAVTLICGWSVTTAVLTLRTGSRSLH
jgi:hypothetical protein